MNWNGTQKDAPAGGLEPDPDFQENRCMHPEHNPPMYICIPYGQRYRHVCPECGKTTLIRSNQVRF